MNMSADEIIAAMSRLTAGEQRAMVEKTQRWRPKVDLLPEDEVRRRWPGAMEALGNKTKYEGFYVDGPRLRARLLTSNYLKHDPVWVGWVEG